MTGRFPLAIARPKNRLPLSVLAYRKSLDFSHNVWNGFNDPLCLLTLLKVVPAWNGIHRVSFHLGVRRRMVFEGHCLVLQVPLISNSIFDGW